MHEGVTHIFGSFGTSSEEGDDFFALNVEPVPAIEREI